MELLYLWELLVASTDATKGLSEHFLHYLKPCVSQLENFNNDCNVGLFHKF